MKLEKGPKDKKLMTKHKVLPLRDSIHRIPCIEGYVDASILGPQNYIKKSKKGPTSVISHRISNKNRQ